MLYKGAGGNTVFNTFTTERIPVQVPISYYLSIRDGVRVSDSITLPNEPEQVTYQFISDHDVVFTVTGEKIHRRAVDRRVSITINGRSGYANKYHWRMRRGADLLDPQEIFAEFNDFLHHDHDMNTGRINQRHRESSAPSLSNSMTFTDLLTGVRFYDCVPVSFTYARSVESSRFGYEWALELVAYSDAQYIIDDKGVIASFFESVTSFLDNITRIVDGYTAIIKSAKAYVIAPIKAALGSVSRVIRAVVNLAESIPDTIASTRGVLTALRDEISNLFNGVVASVAAIKAIADDALFDNKYWAEVWGDWADGQALVDVFGGDSLPPATDATATPVLQDISNALQDLQYNANKALGYLGRLAYASEPPTGSGGSFLDKENAFRLLAGDDQASILSNDRDRDAEQFTVYVLKAGDSLYDVSINVYGDVTLWAGIARANSWLDAHTDAGGNLPRAGQRVLVPVVDGAALLTLSPQLIGGQSPLLTDLLLSDGDLTLSRGLNDVRLVTGADNFSQALLNRLSTERGELPLSLNYGLLDHIGAQNTNKRPEQIALDVLEQVLADERVLTVDNVSINQQGDTLDVRFNASPISGDVVSMIIPV